MIPDITSAMKKMLYSQQIGENIDIIAVTTEMIANPIMGSSVMGSGMEDPAR